MSKLSPIYLLLAALLSITAACNDTSEAELDQQLATYQSTAVKGFNLQADDSVLVSLDSVFFSIDLVNRQIFNADSLPKGTKTNALKVKVSTDLTSNVQLIFSRASGADTTVNYLSTPNEEIDFSQGPVTLRITSYDGTYTADYQLKVNVHKSVPDTLCWSRMAQAAIPTSLTSPTGVKALKSGDKSLVFTTDAAGNACRAESDDIALGGWKNTAVALPSGINIKTITAFDNALYAVASGKLYKSADNGSMWTDTSVAMTWIYGVSGTQLLGCNGTTGVSYPSGAQTALPQDMPVSNTSGTVSFTTKWSAEPYTLTVGGRKADGTLSNGAWAWDGEQWARIDARSSIPELENITLFKYYTYVTNTSNWEIKRYETLFALGGRKADNTVTNRLYLSTDQGFSWSEAGELLQMPESMPGFDAASVIVQSTLLNLNMTTRAESMWTPIESRHVPAWFEIESLPASRVSQAVTEWECPYIYLIGGYGDNGAIINTMWRGVINRLRFNPRY